jgi:hypothetical protein
MRSTEAVPVDARVAALFAEHELEGRVALADIEAELGDTTLAEFEEAVVALHRLGVRVDLPHASEFQKLLTTDFALREFSHSEERIRAGKRPIDTVVARESNAEGAPTPPDDNAAVVEFTARLSRVRILHRDRAKLIARLDSKLSERWKKEIREEARLLQHALAAAVAHLSLSPQYVERIVQKLPGWQQRAEAAREEARACEQRLGVPLREVKRLLSEVRRDPSAARKIAKKLGVGTDELDEIDKVLRTSHRKLSRIREESGISLDVIARISEAIHPSAARRAGVPANADPAVDEEFKRDASLLGLVTSPIGLDLLASDAHTAGTDTAAFRSDLGPTDVESAKRTLDEIFAAARRRAVLRASLDVEPEVSSRWWLKTDIALRQSQLESLAMSLPLSLAWLRRIPARVREQQRRRQRHSTRIARLRQAPRTIPLDLRELQARVDVLATGARVSHALPRPIALAPQNAVLTLRRAALIPRDIKATTPSAALQEDAGATTSDLGKLGESLVFALMRGRWEAAARREPARTATIIRSIAESYWSVSPEVLDGIEEALSFPSGWIRSRFMESLLWPASTTYGDVLGFDLFGLDEDAGKWLCVEVKTTLGPASAQFELSANEYERARRERDRYVLARVSGVRSGRPEVHMWSDPASMVDRGELRLAPASFRVSLAPAVQLASPATGSRTSC